MVNGKAKGDAFENAICALLSDWVVPGDVSWSTLPIADWPFRRQTTSVTPMTGHWKGAGDILHTPGVSFPFCVECKKHEGWELDGLFSAPKWAVWDWWTQATEQAARVKLTPLLLFGRNRRPVYALLPERAALCLSIEPHYGSVLGIQRPVPNCSESLTLCLFRDLVRVPMRHLRKLQSAIHPR